MNKSKLSSWTLALFVICLLGGLSQVNSPQFAESIWTGFGTLAIAAVLCIVTWRLRVSVKKEQAAAAAEEKRRSEQAAAVAKVAAATRGQHPAPATADEGRRGPRLHPGQGELPVDA